MIVSDVEARLGVGYTIDLIRVLQARFPGVHFVWIMGADSLSSFHRWRGWSEIMAKVPMAVVARPGFELRGGLAPSAARFSRDRHPASAASQLPLARPPAWTYLPARLNHASSTALRRGESVTNTRAAGAARESH